MRAGFRLLEVRAVWQPPEELLAPEDGEGEEEGEEWEGDDWDSGEDRIA